MRICRMYEYVRIWRRQKRKSNPVRLKFKDPRSHSSARHHLANSNLLGPELTRDDRKDLLILSSARHPVAASNKLEPCSEIPHTTTELLSLKSRDGPSHSSSQQEGRSDAFAGGPGTWLAVRQQRTLSERGARTQREANEKRPKRGSRHACPPPVPEVSKILLGSLRSVPHTPRSSRRSTTRLENRRLVRLVVSEDLKCVETSRNTTLSVQRCLRHPRKSRRLFLGPVGTTPPLEASQSASGPPRSRDAQVQRATHHPFRWKPSPPTSSAPSPCSSSAPRSPSARSPPARPRQPPR